MKLKFTVIIAWIISTTFFLHAEEINVSDIGSKVILIGRLGKPLGTIATVDGQLISEPQQGKSGQITAALRVNKVDGKQLEKAQMLGLVFRNSTGMPPMHAHDLIQLTGYENGVFVGTPNDIRETLGKDASPLDWKFESMIYVIKAQTADSTKP